MQNVFKRFGAKATDSFSRRFQLTIWRLTAVYLVVLALILFISSSVTYSAFSNRLEHRFYNYRPPANTSYIMFQRILTPEEFRVLPNPADVRQDLILSLIFVNGVLLIGAGALSYYLAQITLDPIRAAYERQRRFLSDASHELRTPLTIMKTDLENLLADQALAEKPREGARSNLEEVERMSRIVNDLLLLSRIDENGEQHRNLAKVDLGQTIEAVADRLKPLADQHGVSIDFVRPTPQLELLTDTNLLQNALVNVIKNAIIYNKAQGLVKINLAAGAGKYKITVADTGIGISQTDLARIFDRFYRAEPSRSRETGGSGLGLSIVQAAVKNLGGTIDIESEPDRGTTVSIALPIK
jgi:signal transduction histidine kinase